MMRLEPGSLISDQRIGRRVRFVEAVACKQLHQVEKFDRESGVIALFNGALLEQLTVRRHFLWFFLAHGASEQIRATQ